MSMTILNIVALSCFISVFGYIVSLYILDKYNVEEKYPKLKWIINYFKKSSQFTIIVESLIGFLALIVMLVINLFLITIVSSALLK